jgi:arylsulfatase A-like enzyme
MHWAGGIENGYEPLIADGRRWLELLDEKKRRVHEAETVAHTRRTTGGPSPRTLEEHWGWHVARGTIAAIEEAVGRAEPFLAWCSFTEPHPPFRPPLHYYLAAGPQNVRIPAQPPSSFRPHPRVAAMREEWAHLSEHEWRQIIAAYYGMVSLADTYAGMVLDCLDRVGVREETLVIWHSDHGDQAGEHGMMLKFTMREASVRVPLFISAPGLEPAVREEPVEAVDIFPTICAMLGIETPPSVQGRSLEPLLRSRPEAGDEGRPCFSQIGDVEMIRTPQWKLNLYAGVPGELFHLAADPDEFENLIASPEHGNVREGLFSRLAAWREANTPDFEAPGVLRT